MSKTETTETIPEWNLPHGPLHADLYAFTMSLALFRAGTHNTPVTFHSFIRRTPFNGSYAVSAGLADALKWLENFKFTRYRIRFLRSLKTQAGNRLFDDEFLQMVKETPLSVTIDALPEGALAFANVPIMRISGPMWQCLIVEAIFLNIINAQSLIATEAARCVLAATNPVDGSSLPIMDGSLRRALEVGGRSSARATFIGGFVGTSNVAAAMDLGIPTRGTFAHAFVVFHDTEEEAFRTYVRHMEDITILLDTYNTLAALYMAIRVCKEEGKELKAVRLDSGDLAWFSLQCRSILNDTGMRNTKVMISNDLNPHSISSLVGQMHRGEASIQMLMVGTAVGAPSQSSIGGVYKLMDVNGRAVIKVAERSSMGADEKTTIPGSLGTLRFLKETVNGTQFDSDTILSLGMQQQLAGLTAANDNPDKVYHLPQSFVSVNMADPDRPKQFAKGYAFTIPHIRVVENGVILGTHETSLQTIQKYAHRNLGMLDRTHLRLEKPHVYIAGIEDSLYEMRRRMTRDIHLESQARLAHEIALSRALAA